MKFKVGDMVRISTANPYRCIDYTKTHQIIGLSWGGERGIYKVRCMMAWGSGLAQILNFDEKELIEIASKYTNDIRNIEK